MAKNLKVSLQKLPIEHLQRGQHQPRQQFNKVALAELAQSIKSQGLLQPILVCPCENGRYEIIAGERRWRAAQLAQLSEVDCLVRSYTKEQAIAASTIENINRVDLNPIEEAQAYKRFIEELHYTHEEIAAVVGKHRTHVSNILRLLGLAPQVQQYLIQSDLSEGHGKVLASLEVSDQLYFAKTCIEEGWSVRQLERKIKKPAFRPSEGRRVDPDIVQLENYLSERFATEVKLEQDSQKKTGWLKLRYFNADTLDGLLEKLEKLANYHE